MDYDNACLMHLQRRWLYRISVPYAQKKVTESSSKREGGNPGNSGLSYQQWMVVHYPRTVWKNSYAEHEVTFFKCDLTVQVVRIQCPSAHLSDKES